MKRALVLVTLLVGLRFGSIAAADVSISDNGKKATIDCGKDPNVTVNGNKVDLTFTGACTAVTVNGNKGKLTIASTAAITVSGNDNTIAITAVDALTVNGSHNTISYKGAVAKGGSVAATNTGKNNTVTAGK